MGLTWLATGVVEQRPERLLHLALVLDGHLGQDVSGPVDHTTLAQAVREDQLHRPDEPRGAVGDDQQWRPQAAGHC
jgi:hypothetical protein